MNETELQELETELAQCQARRESIEVERVNADSALRKARFDAGNGTANTADVKEAQANFDAVDGTLRALGERIAALENHADELRTRQATAAKYEAVRAAADACLVSLAEYNGGRAPLLEEILQIGAKMSALQVAHVANRADFLKAAQNLAPHIHHGSDRFFDENEKALADFARNGINLSGARHWIGGPQFQFDERVPVTATSHPAEQAAHAAMLAASGQQSAGVPANVAALLAQNATAGENPMVKPGAAEAWRAKRTETKKEIVRGANPR